MKGCMPILPLIFLFLILQTTAQSQVELNRKIVDHPEAPRVSAYEAYTQYKAGKGIILHAGGEAYSRMHILGAFNVDMKDREKLLLKFPQKGIEIFTYCY